MSVSQGDEAFTPDLLKFFYSRLFPFKTYVNWLNYGIDSNNAFKARELSFTLSSDAYIRFQSFNGAEDLKAEIMKLCPTKIDIGAIYTAKPRDKKATRASAFKPIEKELIFDIDMTDYDEIRTCCSGASVCHKCWKFMTVAIKIIDTALREDFGFKHLLWVYSGRRGVHCWVCDEFARKLSNEIRSAIVSYLAVIKGGAQVNKKVHFNKILHPFLRRSLDIIDKYFEDIVLKDQDVLGSEENWSKVLNCIPDDEIIKKLTNKWNSSNFKSSVEKWKELVSELDNAANVSGKKFSKKTDQLQFCKFEIMFQYTYPRIDEAVSKNINHLLKGPFCAHPKTGRICVPIQPEDCENFDPFKVPTVSSIYHELNQYTEGERKVHDYEKTSLKPYIKYFDVFVNGILTEVRHKNRDNYFIDLKKHSERTFHTTSPVLKRRPQEIKKKNIAKKLSKLEAEKASMPDPIVGIPSEFTKSLLQPLNVYKGAADPNAPQYMNYFLNEKDEDLLFEKTPMKVAEEVEKSHKVGSEEVDNLIGLIEEEKKKAEILKSLVSLHNSNAKSIMMYNVKKTVEEFGRNENDTGSAEVQAAILTVRILNLYGHLQNNRKDKHNYRGLRKLVHKRQKLLKYLKRESLERYFTTIKKLGLDERVIEGEIVI
ncbi:15730_t:CDS:10 [Cetraspora pellucida]|uniref:DNA primase n=1 Tax=Cetraspora pellucida TaxID=1433469 RepID=A0A9N9HNU0_9GLOM|nr:15730_t:CDS:10 [Cetraspora pellucida]